MVYFVVFDFAFA